MLDAYDVQWHVVSEWSTVVKSTNDVYLYNLGTESVLRRGVEGKMAMRISPERPFKSLLLRKRP